jgi:CheY-like chemotaxis protein
MRDLFTTGQVAQICEISAMTVIRYCDSGKIKAFKSPVTSVRRIPREELVRFMKAYDIPIGRLEAYEKVRVFVVDDEAAQVEVVQRALEKMPGSFEVESSTSGYDAVIRIGSFRPDLVVLDLLMPNVDGFEVCRAIRSVPETSDAKILVVTGFPTPENIEKARNAGADDYLEKPLRIQPFREKVGALLGISTGE